jgi:hypothetical protein
MSTKAETTAACHSMLSSMPACRMLGSNITCGTARHNTGYPSTPPLGVCSNWYGTQQHDSRCALHLDCLRVPENRLKTASTCAQEGSVPSGSVALHLPDPAT